MTAVVAFLALFLAAAIAALYLGQRRDERDEEPDVPRQRDGSDR